MRFPRAEFMRLALRLARKGAGRTSPNPAVGAVLVRRGEVVGEGFHRAAGLPHAEAMALQDAGEAARGADLYVTLEPCAHAGRTGPCTRAIIAAGVRRVAAAMQDPNPLVAGKGFRALRRAGIPVVRGMMEEEARSLNRSYCRWVVSGRPFVTLKLAISLDGQVASASGESRWISGDPARKIVHRMRSETDAVLVGGETYRQDAPQLTARVRGGRNPGRVILTSRIAGVARSGRFLKAGGRVIVAAPRGVSREEALRDLSDRTQVEDLKIFVGALVLADTVGFIRHLPHDLVEAFRSTLQETSEAHLLLHVIDASDENRDSQIEEVESVLEQIQADRIQRIQIMNKIDINGVEPRVDYDSAGHARRIWLSAGTGDGLGV